MTIPNGLGVLVGGSSFRAAIEGLDLAARHGFREVQVNLSWHPYAGEELHRIALALRERRLHCRAVGVYCDLLQDESHHFFSTSCRQIRELLPQLSAIGSGLVVAWSGSYANDLLADDPRNHTPESMQQIRQHIEAMGSLLRRHHARLAIEPWKTHVLGDAASLAKFCDACPDMVRAVVDVPNVLDLRDWPHRTEKSVELIGALQRGAGIVHLKDMSVRADGSFDLPGPGLGQLDYSAILEAIRPLWRKVPFIIEHVTEPQIDAAAKFVIEGMRKRQYDFSEAGWDGSRVA